MKKAQKIILWILGGLVAIISAVIISADILVSRFVQTEVNTTLAKLPGCEAQVGAIHLRFFSATASVDSLSFSYRGKPINRQDTIGPGVSIRIRRIEVGRLFYTMLLSKHILISDLHIVEPQLELWMDEKHPELCFPQLHDDELKKTDNWKACAELMQFHIDDASFRMHSLRTHLDVAVDSCSVALRNLAYDSVFHYCDSVYRFALRHAAVMLPDGLMRLETNDICQRDQGALSLGQTRITHTMPRKQLGEIMREPVTWMDMHIESVTTAPFNPIRKALANDYTLEAANVVVSKMDIFRDARFQPKQPFQMPQEPLANIPVTFCLNHADALIRRIDIAFASTDINCGELHLNNIRTAIDSLSNLENSTMRVHGFCPIDKGKAKAEMTMTMNKACDFGTCIHVENVEANMLNSFVRPLVGITFDFLIDTLDTRYTGDRVRANGTFRMLYHGLKVQVHKEDNIPYKIVKRNAGTFNSFANTMIPKSNPSTVDIQPRAYQVTWKRDEWKPFPLYMFGPCIDGAVKTMLPGLYVHKQVR